MAGVSEFLFDFIAGNEASLAATAVDAIREAISILERHPLIRRPAEQGLGELLISCGQSAYVALYRSIEHADVVLVLAAASSTRSRLRVDGGMSLMTTDPDRIRVPLRRRLSLQGFFHDPDA